MGEQVRTTGKMYVPGRIIQTIVTEMGEHGGRKTYRLIYHRDLSKLHVWSPSRKGVSLYYQKFFLKKWIAEQNDIGQISRIAMLNASKGKISNPMGGGWRVYILDGPELDFITDPITAFAA